MRPCTLSSALVRAGMIQPANGAGGVRDRTNLYAQSVFTGANVWTWLLPSYLQLYPMSVLGNVCLRRVQCCALILNKMLGSEKWDWRTAGRGSLDVAGFESGIYIQCLWVPDTRRLQPEHQKTCPPASHLLPDATCSVFPLGMVRCFFFLGFGCISPSRNFKKNLQSPVTAPGHFKLWPHGPGRTDAYTSHPGVPTKSWGFHFNVLLVTEGSGTLICSQDGDQHGQPAICADLIERCLKWAQASRSVPML